MARLSILQKKEIINPVTFTEAEVRRIKARNYDWDYYYLGDIIKKARKHYTAEQNKLCSFCKLPFRDDIHVEHMIPKSGKQKPRKEFSYTPRNLSVACKHCNSMKSTNNDLILSVGNNYPNSGLYFRIIHPHFDKYFDNIAIVDKSRYVAKTVKGYNTIKRCHLYEQKMSDLLVKYMRYEDDPIIHGYLRIKDMAGDFRPTIDRFLSRILK